MAVVEAQRPLVPRGVSLHAVWTDSLAPCIPPLPTRPSWTVSFHEISTCFCFKQRSLIKNLIKRIKEAQDEGVRDDDGIEDATALVRAAEAEVWYAERPPSWKPLSAPATRTRARSNGRMAIAEAVEAGSHEETVKEKQALQARLHAELDLNRSSQTLRRRL